MPSPYANLPSRAYWRSAVGERASLDPGDVFQPKFPITKEMKVTTAGSCFAQHVGRALRGAGFNVQDAERLPPVVSDAVATRFGYRLYSARYGNIYTMRQLLQLNDETKGTATPALPVWEKDGRFFDAQRPSVEPEGLASEADVMTHRASHLKHVRATFRNSDLFVFTFGLTEAWVHKETGTVYPTAPGTIAGAFDPDVFEFKNFSYSEIRSDFLTFRKKMMAANPDMKFLITVSPVPLTATASGRHVEVASSYSKSTLVAVCGALREEFDNVDYFPSYEIITSQNARGAYYASNKREVSSQGVATAMGVFLKSHGFAPSAPHPTERQTRSAMVRSYDASAGRAAAASPSAEETAEDVVCEEALLDAFSK
ncbi:GSCFA domain-containing protein [Ascidiaceihabitans sp.]|uniref:GSCFA domain-containing protein n=1 Tax=Ascidiaceihabitans sp. TaxID=1872644 RepID=UPI00329A1C70